MFLPRDPLSLSPLLEPQPRKPRHAPSIAGSWGRLLLNKRIDLPVHDGGNASSWKNLDNWLSGRREPTQRAVVQFLKDANRTGFGLAPGRPPRPESRPEALDIEQETARRLSRSPTPWALITDSVGWECGGDRTQFLRQEILWLEAQSQQLFEHLKNDDPRAAVAALEASAFHRTTTVQSLVRHLEETSSLRADRGPLIALSLIGWLYLLVLASQGERRGRAYGALRFRPHLEKPMKTWMRLRLRACGDDSLAELSRRGGLEAEERELKRWNQGEMATRRSFGKLLKDDRLAPRRRDHLDCLAWAAIYLDNLWELSCDLDAAQPFHDARAPFEDIDRLVDIARDRRAAAGHEGPAAA